MQCNIYTVYTRECLKKTVDGNWLQAGAIRCRHNRPARVRLDDLPSSRSLTHDTAPPPLLTPTPNVRADDAHARPPGQSENTGARRSWTNATGNSGFTRPPAVALPRPQIGTLSPAAPARPPPLCCISPVARSALVLHDKW